MGEGLFPEYCLSKYEKHTHIAKMGEDADALTINMKGMLLCK